MQQLLASLNPLRELSSNFYFADLFDIAIIALFIYAVFSLFRQTRSFSILIGIGIIVILYVTAQAFDLYLTRLTLQAFFGVSLIVFVVLFQEELRRFFEFLAIGPQKRRQSMSREAVTELVLAIAGLARRKTGALVILVGSENIERHLQGGQELDALVSEELIASLFDPNSPGHDGALIIVKNRASQFGAHLPLSNDFKQIGKFGTRHSAALGISELSDAIAIAISEERGTISVARAGKLETLKNAEDLEKILEKFQKEKFPERQSPLKNLLRRNIIAKVGALTVALTLWFFTSYQAETIQRDLVIPITFRNPPEGLAIAQSQPRNVTVTLQSRGSAFDQLDTRSVGVEIDVSNLELGKNQIQIYDALVRRPFNFSVVAIEPQDVDITLERFVLKELTVDAHITGKPAPLLTVDSVIITPGTIPLLVPETFDSSIHITTDEIDITGISQRTTYNATLALPEGIRIPSQAELNILVTVTVKRK